MGSETDEVASLLEDSSDILDINEVNKIAMFISNLSHCVFLLKINDIEYDIPSVTTPSLESVLWDMESEEGSDSASLHSLQSMTLKFRSMLYHCVLQGLTAQITSAEVSFSSLSETDFIGLILSAKSWCWFTNSHNE